MSNRSIGGWEGRRIRRARACGRWRDTTAYLLRSKANQRWLDEALEEARTGRGIVLTINELRALFGV